MFQLKNFTSIAGAMINHMRGTQSDITDFVIGSKARTLVEAPAIEMDELYQQMFNGLKEAIPVATYNSFSFSRLPAAPASGLVIVNITSSATDVVIPTGTVFNFQGGAVSYSSTADVTIGAGSTSGNVPVAASVAGIAGNLAASVSLTPSPLPAGFVSAVNAAAFLNGEDAETDDQRKSRFALYISTLQRGTLAALDYGARSVVLYDVHGLETERVRCVSVVEPFLTDVAQPVGLVEVFVHNGLGSTSSTLVAQVNTVLIGYTDANGTKVPGWKAAGVHLVVAVATEVPLNVSAVLTAAAGYDPTLLIPQASAAIAAYIQGIDIGGTWVESEATFLIMSIPGVANITGLPTDLTSMKDEKIVLGTLAVTSA